jgi:hypothetical protein
MLVVLLRCCDAAAAGSKEAVWGSDNDNSDENVVSER